MDAVCGTGSAPGSPPLTRGIQRAFQPCSCRHRFTPAHAGNTLESNPTVLQDRVHPRSRGEYILEGKYFCSRIGSPPLTRGILGSTVSSTSSMRFTPAHAGNTLLWRCSYLCRWVHPRSRGEYSFLRLQDMVHGGSPPLTRGILKSNRVQMPESRFTPAHAGNTSRKV